MRYWAYLVGKLIAIAAVACGLFLTLQYFWLPPRVIIGNVVLVLIQLFSFYQRYRYGTSAVVPLGLSLSFVAVLIMLFTGWKGGDLVFRHRVAVYDEPRP